MSGDRPLYAQNVYSSCGERAAPSTSLSDNFFLSAIVLRTEAFNSRFAMDVYYYFTHSFSISTQAVRSFHGQAKTFSKKNNLYTILIRISYFIKRPAQANMNNTL